MTSPTGLAEGRRGHTAVAAESSTLLSQEALSGRLLVNLGMAVASTKHVENDRNCVIHKT